MPSSHLILRRPFLLLPPIPPSIRVFSNESTLRMRWPKYWSFSFSISPSNEHPGLISFRMDWLNLLAVQGTLKTNCVNLLLFQRDKKYLSYYCIQNIQVCFSHYGFVAQQKFPQQLGLLHNSWDIQLWLKEQEFCSDLDQQAKLQPPASYIELPRWLSSKESSWVPSLEKEMVTHSSILTCENSQRSLAGYIQSMGSQKSWTQLRD